MKTKVGKCFVESNKKSIFAISKITDNKLKQLKVMENKKDYSKMSLAELLKLADVAYIGGIKHSTKMTYSYNHNVATYCIYLSPSDLAGKRYKTCPNDKYCRDLCLNGSGRNLGLTLADENKMSVITKGRIKKTKLFYDNRELFMEIVVREIIRFKKYAEKRNMGFAVRLNGTSDLSPLLFQYKGKNILELFPDVQFYDYTKVYSRISLPKKYKNYDLTLSYNGYNWNDCKDYLTKKGKVAVVFENNLPTLFHGFHVIDANGYDMRYLDEPGTIMGLHYHRVANNYKNGRYVEPDTNFVVKESNKHCVYNFDKEL